MKIITNSERLYLLAEKMGLEIEWDNSVNDNDLYFMIEGNSIDDLCDFAESTRGRMILRMFGG